MSSVLLVDDEPAIRRLLSTFIETLGMSAIPAPDAESALTLLDSTIPDLIISDVKLPGLSGDELARIVKSDPRFQVVPVILISAYHEPPNHQADAFLAKPFDLDALYELMDSYVRP